MAANTIPIYFGDYNVAERFNTKSFINFHEYDNITDLVKRVKQINENDELWRDIMLESWQTNDQKQKVMEEISRKPHEFIKNIFRQEIKDAKRKGVGLHISTYREKNIKIFNNNLSYLKIINTIAWWIPIKKWRENLNKNFFSYCN